MITENTSSSTQLPKLLASWRHFVSQVEHGYQFGIYEYENDLSVRDHIKQELSRGVVPSVLLASELQQLDARLRDVLVPTLKPLYEDALPDAFWYYGLPYNSGDELINDAHSYGLLK